LHLSAVKQHIIDYTSRPTITQGSWITCLRDDIEKLEGIHESAYLYQVKWFKHYYCKM